MPKRRSAAAAASPPIPAPTMAMDKSLPCRMAVIYPLIPAKAGIQCHMHRTSCVAPGSPPARGRADQCVWFHIEYGLSRRGDRLQEGDKVIGDMVDMRGVAAFELPVLAQHFAGAGGHHQHGGHAKLMGYCGVAREVFEHGGARGLDGVRLEEARIGHRRWFRLKLG